jgi:hypothetical protein
MSAIDLNREIKAYPNMPADLRDFFAIIGSGTIGRSRYKIHALLTPEDVYDEETAEALEGIVIVGDDFAGYCDAYDTRGKAWVFGGINENGQFEPSPNSASFLEFLAARFGGPTSQA